MRVTLKRAEYLDHSRTLRVIPMDRAQGLIVECEVADPPSVKGRTVYLHLWPEDITRLLLLLRDEAIHARSQPLPSQP